ncbi:MAG TPA: flippase [Acidobacteriaceae bacterium]|jgi:O-antigen/teichoic acid export membrane protein
MPLREQIQRLRGSTLAKNSAWMFMGQGLSVVVQGGYFFVLARLLGSLQYGVLVGSVALVMMFSQYSNFGSGLIFMRYVSLDRKTFPLYWGNILLTTSIFGCILVAGVHLGAPWLMGAGNRGILTTLAIGEFLGAQLTVAVSQIFQAFEQMRITATLSLLTNLSRLVVAVILFLKFHRIAAWQWAYASMAVALCAAMISVITVLKKFGKPVFDPRLALRRAGEGFIFAISGTTTSAYNDLDKAMLGHYGMNAANGIYTMAYRVVDISFMPVRSIYNAAFPRFFQLGAGGLTATSKLASRLIRKTTLLCILAAVGMFVCAPLIPFLAGHGFDKSVVALRWLCLIPLFRSFHMCAGDALAGVGLQPYRLAAQTVAALGNFGLNLYLIPHYSWRGAAAASLMTDGGLAVMCWLLLFGLRARERSRGVPSPEASPEVNLGSS